MIKSQGNSPSQATAIGRGAASSRLDRIAPVAVTSYVILSAGILFISLFLSLTWLRLPFLGALWNRALAATSARPIDPSDAWDLQRQGIGAGDVLSSVNDLPVRTSADLRFALSRLTVGDTIPVTIRSQGSGQATLQVRLGAFSALDQLVYLALPAVTALGLLTLSIWILIARGREPAGRALVLLAASLSIAASALFDLYSTHALAVVGGFALAVAGGALIQLAFSFPSESTLARAVPALPSLGYLVGLGTWTIAVQSVIKQDSLPHSTGRGSVVLAWVAFAGLTYLLVNLRTSLAARSPVARSLARMIVAAILLGCAPFAVWAPLSRSDGLDMAPYLALPAALIPIAVAYAMQRFRFSDAANWSRKAVVYALLSIVILGTYAILVAGLSLTLGTAMPSGNPLWIGALALILALLLEPIRNRLQNLTDRAFFRKEGRIAQIVEGYVHDLGGALNLDSIARVVRAAAENAVAPSAVHVYVYDDQNDQYTALRDETGRPSSDIHFGGRGALAQTLTQARQPLYLDGQSPQQHLESDQSRLAVLGVDLFLPLSGKGSPLGWIALGPKKSGKRYTPSDMNLLEQLADQVAMTINRVQTVDRLERRLQEMNALTRVAQGVNITLTFDDVLELIYAQTAQILPLSHFHITLRGHGEDNYFLAFALEDNERLTARENASLPVDLGLEREVIRRGRPLITQDYARECAGMGLEPIAQGILGWMGVPLNAGAESIGVLSIGSRERGVTYTRSQLDLLHAVADQTAGAIVKARLLRETEQRAIQLGKLNDVTQRLASTLEMDPLRQTVVDGAVSILDCEAGLLYGLDQSTGELIVRTVSGSLQKELVGQQVPAASGNATQAATSRAAAVNNNLVPGSGSHFLDQVGAGFVPRASMAVPIQIQDSIIGVLELINRHDGGPFVSEDQALLMALAGQAAVALENVRLYTLTDRELAARLEELSVMQRIDRELNASLEMDRAMRITLEWALRQSNADAGLIGLLEDNRLRVIAELGYGSIVTGAADQTMSLTLPGFQPAVETGLPQRVRLEAPGPTGFLPLADHQVVIPIRREAGVIGLLVLESTRAAQEDLGFLGRLSDHAAIAISNAQLYDEVQRANIAKSDFVSLVAHELKNPMTSIKGYTELLAAGAVGPVNEMQANFLNTIRSNTERMSTLVSDLNDNSKIEAGRLRLDFRSVDLVEVIEETIRSAKRQIEEKKQVVQFELPDQLPGVWADQVRLGQVFTNLVSNANKYTPEGGLLAVGAESSANLWDPEGVSRVVHVWVRDNGIGIGADDQARIFQKFFRSEDPKAREVPGAGLGLNITRSLVEMQGGRIWFESEYHHGTTFHFTVPVAEA